MKVWIAWAACLVGASWMTACATELSDAERNNSTEMNRGPAAKADSRAADGVRVLFLGNSITLHGVAPGIGWTNYCGMAASVPEKDYVHLVTRGIEKELGCTADVRVRNLAAFERSFKTWDVAKELADDIAFRPEYLVVALGENVPSLATEEDRLAYRAAFKRLLESFTYGRMKPHVAVRGVFWANTTKDEQMAHAASDLAMPFVPAACASDDEKAIGLFKHGGVAAHPGDRGMRRIADLILETLFPTKSGYAATVDGRSVPVRPTRVSAQPFNQWAPGYQRPVDQTEVAGMLRFETVGAARLVVRPDRAFAKAQIRPLSAKVACTTQDGAVSFTLPRPGNYVLELDGWHRPLEIFAQPKRDFAAERKAANVVFGPGIHNPVVVKLKSHDRVYIDKDAVVYGSFQADGVTDVRVSGYGIISGARNRRVGNACYREGMDGTVRIIDSKDVAFDGPTVLDSCCWCVAVFNSEDVALRNLKVTEAWRYNTDGIDICNSRRVRVEGCYVHAFDDALVVKGISHDYVAQKGVLSLDFPRNEAIEDVSFSNCVCWCGWGRTLELGLETWAASIRGVRFEDCDLVHNCHGALSVHLGGPAVVEDVAFRRIRVECDGLEERSVLQKRRDARFVPRTDVTIHWLVVENAKMFSPKTLYSGLSGEHDYSKEPYGTFRTLTVEDIDLFTTNGGKNPVRRIAPQPGTSFGTMKVSRIRLNGEATEL